jgi:hypothetical protein
MMPNGPGPGKSSAEVLGVPGAALAETLTGHLVQEIIFRGSGGGPLTPLADQLNHDLTHLQGQRVEGMLARLVALITTPGWSAGPGGMAPYALFGSDGGAEAAGWPLEEVTDPFAVEVHWPLHLEDQLSGLSALPMYVLREHDTELSIVVQAAAQAAAGLRCW